MHARGSLVYKIIYSAVDEKPGVRDNFLKRMVGARGFEPPTPWSRTFGPEGPTKCSGLDVIRYDAESLHNEFGARFRLVESSKELHETPFGTKQQFLLLLLSDRPTLPILTQHASLSCYNGDRDCRSYFVDTHCPTRLAGSGRDVQHRNWFAGDYGSERSRLPDFGTLIKSGTQAVQQNQTIALAVASRLQSSDSYLPIDSILTESGDTTPKH